MYYDYDYYVGHLEYSYIQYHAATTITTVCVFNATTTDIIANANAILILAITTPLSPLYSIFAPVVAATTPTVATTITLHDDATTTNVDVADAPTRVVQS